VEPAFEHRPFNPSHAQEIDEIVTGAMPTYDERAWKLLTVAHELTARGDHHLALAVIEAAVTIDQSHELVAAAHTLSLTIDDRLEGRRRSKPFLRLRTRLYWELWQRTNSSRFRVRWRRCSDALAEAEQR
jgi:hypothetical protein